MAQSAVIAPVPEAEALVGSWREALDPSARLGVPAHVTLLFPFRSPDGLTAQVIEALARVAAATPAFDFRLRTTARFPGVLYLAPEPADPFVALTRALVRRFPDCPPYGGRHPSIVPHLTVGQADPSALDRTEVAIARSLEAAPIAARCREIVLIENSSGRWRPLEVFSLGS